MLFEELAEQAFGGLLVAPVLDENIENDAFWSTARQSQCFLAAMLLTTSSRMPFVATARRSLTDAVGEYPPEFAAARLAGNRQRAPRYGKDLWSMR